MILTKKTLKIEEKRLKMSYFASTVFAQERDNVVNEINNYLFALSSKVTEMSFTESLLTESLLTEADNELVSEMKKSIRGLRKFTRLHYANSYKEWVDSTDREIKMKLAHGYDRRLESLSRPYGYMDTFTLEDPVTDDELEYALGFAKDVYPEKNYKRIEDVEIGTIRGAIQCLMTN
jgi:hypothetical protein